MGKGPGITTRGGAFPILSHASGFVVLFFLAMWLRAVPLESDPVLQGYLQVTTGLLAFVFAAVTLVRFQGTQDRISLILGSGFLLSGTLLTASSVLFFQFLQETPVHLNWAPVSWWVGRIVLGLLLVVGSARRAFSAALAPSAPGDRRRVAHRRCAHVPDHRGRPPPATGNFTASASLHPQPAATPAGGPFSHRPDWFSSPFANRRFRLRSCHLFRCLDERGCATCRIAIGEACSIRLSCWRKP